MSFIRIIVDRFKGLYQESAHAASFEINVPTQVKNTLQVTGSIEVSGTLKINNTELSSNAAFFQTGPYDIATIGGTSVSVFGWSDIGTIQLNKVQLFLVNTASIGTYQFTLTKDPNGTESNMLSSSYFDLTTLQSYRVTTASLSSTTANLTLTSSQTWRASFTSNNENLNARGVYFSLTWQKL